jgi:glycosyltransferase involved in cell wall biosynthesis
MSQPERRAAMAAAARQRVLDHFSWRSIAAQTRSFYDELVQR